MKRRSPTGESSKSVISAAVDYLERIFGFELRRSEISAAGRTHYELVLGEDAVTLFGALRLALPLVEELALWMLLPRFEEPPVARHHPVFAEDPVGLVPVVVHRVLSIGPGAAQGGES